MNKIFSLVIISINDIMNNKEKFNFVKKYKKKILKKKNALIYYYLIYLIF